MVSIFSTGKVKNLKITNINDPKIKEFDNSLHSVLLNLAKRVAADGEGASKFITINVSGAKTQEDAKKIAFSIANSPFVKTAIAGEDPNWGRIIMAIGKANVNINLNKLQLNLDQLKLLKKVTFKLIIMKRLPIYEKEKIDLTVDWSWNKKFYRIHNGFNKKIY